MNSAINCSHREPVLYTKPAHVIFQSDMSYIGLIGWNGEQDTDRCTIAVCLEREYQVDARCVCIKNLICRYGNPSRPLQSHLERTDGSYEVELGGSQADCKWIGMQAISIIKFFVHQFDSTEFE